MNALATNIGGPPLFALCAALEMRRSTLYQHRRAARMCSMRTKPARALSHDERSAMVGHLHSDRFVDRAPAEVAQLLADLDVGTSDCHPQVGNDNPLSGS